MAFAPGERVRSSFKRSAPRVQTNISVDDECVFVTIPGVSETRWFWSGFAGLAQNDKLLLLYTNKDCFLILPISTMSADQRVELSEIVERNMLREQHAD